MQCLERQNDVAGFCCFPVVPPVRAGRVTGVLSVQTPVSSTVPKIAQVRTGQHKEVLFGSPVPFQNNIKEWLCPSLKRYIKSKKTQQLPVLYKQECWDVLWAGNTGSLYYISGNKKNNLLLLCRDMQTGSLSSRSTQLLANCVFEF